MTFDTTTLLLIVGLTASIVHILHLTFPSNKTMAKIDDLAGEVRRLFPIPPSTPQSPTPVIPPGSMATLTTKVAPLLIVFALIGCGASARQKTLTAAIATMTASETALTTYNHKHEIDIASDQSATPEQRHEKLVAYRATRDKVEFAIDLAWRALGIAGPLNDDTSLVNVKLAVSQVITVVEALIHGGTP